MKSFPFPLPAEALELFCAPSSYGPTFHRPMRVGDEVWAANGYVAIKAHRGHWLPEDYQEAAEHMDFRRRIESLDWSPIERLKLDDKEWKSLEPEWHRIQQWKSVDPWLLVQGRHTLAPSPIVRIRDTRLCRVSWLTLIRKLPRIEILVSPVFLGSPVHFRFNGGCGIIAADPNLKISNVSIFNTQP